MFANVSFHQKIKSVADQWICFERGKVYPKAVYTFFKNKVFLFSFSFIHINVTITLHTYKQYKEDTKGSKR